MTWNADWLALIDSRVKALVQRSSAVGTLSSRPSDTSVYVTFDGSTVAVPCKVFGDVNAYPGDRVGLQRFGSDWVVVGTYTRRYPAEWTQSGQGSGQSTTSGTYQDITGLSGTIVKRDNASRLRATFNGTYYNAGSPANTAETYIGVKFTAQDGGTVYGTYTIGELYMNPQNGHVGGFAYTPAATLPAGSYTVQYQWYRAGGSGTPTLTVDDWYSVTVKEVGP
jgi:hypothetical protein